VGIVLAEIYRPQHLQDIKGQPTYELQKWAETWNPNTSIKSAFLYGPPGVGKTSTAKALANDMGWEYLEINASDSRNPKEVKELIGHAIFNTPWETRILILIDEVDNLTKSAFKMLEALIELSKNPIIITCNDEYGVKKTTQFFRKNSLLIKFSQLKDHVIQTIVTEIASKEQFKIEDLPNLLKASHGDARFAINNIKSSKDLEPRHEDKDIFKITHDIFQGNWDGDMGDNDIEFIWYTVKSNIYNFYDDIYSDTVPSFIDHVNRFFEIIHQELSDEGKRAYRYWPYIINVLKLMPYHQKTARIEIPRVTVPEIRNQYYKKKDPDLDKMARYLHCSYAKVNNSEMKQFLKFVPKETPEAREDYKRPSLSLPPSTVEPVTRTQNISESNQGSAVSAALGITPQAGTSLQIGDYKPEKKWKKLM
jgi:hypothetical protein